MIKLDAIVETTETTPYHELSFDHPNKLMSVRVFRARQDATEYIKYQGWTTRQAVVRMCKMPGHEWANSRDNVVVIRAGDKEPASGWEYLFSHGAWAGLWAHGMPK